MWTKPQEQEFAQLLFVMGEVFNDTVTADRAELYCRVLQDVPFASVLAAATAHLKTSRFFPRPADLRVTPEDGGDLAWVYLLREVRRIGYMGTPTWPDAATKRAALGLFGGSWRTLCELLPAHGPELLGFRKAFLASFAAAARQPDAGLSLPPTRDESAAALSDLKAALVARGLPAKGL